MKRIYTDERVAELRESLETEPASLAKTLALTLLDDVARYEDALAEAASTLNTTPFKHDGGFIDAAEDVCKTISGVNDAT
jgi:hypothetical protein